MTNMICDTCGDAITTADVEVAASAGWSDPVCGDCAAQFYAEQAPIDGSHEARAAE